MGRSLWGIWQELAKQYLSFTRATGNGEKTRSSVTGTLLQLRWGVGVVFLGFGWGWWWWCCCCFVGVLWGFLHYSPRSASSASRADQPLGVVFETRPSASPGQEPPPPPPSPFSGRFVHPSQSRPRASPPPPRGGPCPRGAQALPSASAKGNAVPLLRPFPLKQGPGQGEGGGPLRTPGGIAGGVCNPLCGPPLPPPLALCCQLLSVKRCCCAPSMQVCICVMFRLAL